MFLMNKEKRMVQNLTPALVGDEIQRTYRSTPVQCFVSTDATPYRFHMLALHDLCSAT
jgi:hypothetical protein